MSYTRKQLENDVKAMAKMTNTDLTVDYTYGRPRIHRRNESMDVSPRLSTGQMIWWIEGFVAAHDLEWWKRHQTPKTRTQFSFVED